MKSWRIIQKYLSLQIRITKEEAENETYLEIKEGTNFKGYNLWILGFAMVIACIGLTTDSLSAVIGAMLISPLMGPIIGMAFGLAINDRALKIQGLKNWILMTSASLISASIFFLINPFDDSTDMLDAFKKASIFDIFLAFFGGMAGFVGILKKEGTKIIAGVAIATACMPPLCTAAYGLAHLDYKFILGGFYFYIINCMFIGWATYLLTRYFKFNQILGSKQKLKYILLWDIVIVLMLLPGLYIAYDKWKAEENRVIQVSDKARIEILEKKIEQLEQKFKQ